MNQMKIITGRVALKVPPFFLVRKLMLAKHMHVDKFFLLDHFDRFDS